MPRGETLYAGTSVRPRKIHTAAAWTRLVFFCAALHARPLRGFVAASDSAVVSILGRPPLVVTTADFVADAVRVDVAAFRT